MEFAESEVRICCGRVGVGDGVIDYHTKEDGLLIDEPGCGGISFFNYPQHILRGLEMLDVQFGCQLQSFNIPKVGEVVCNYILTSRNEVDYGNGGVDCKVNQSSKNWVVRWLCMQGEHVKSIGIIRVNCPPVLGTQIECQTDGECLIEESKVLRTICGQRALKTSTFTCSRANIILDRAPDQIPCELGTHTVWVGINLSSNTLSWDGLHNRWSRDGGISTWRHIGYMPHYSTVSRFHWIDGLT
jgi:hypothetical protein